MNDHAARRPHMTGYGVLPADEGAGLLPWSWATERLTRSHDYWLATVRPDGRPHVMPVWATWDDDGLLFSTAPMSRKARNLAAEPRCTVTTDDALEPVVVDGVAELVTDRGVIGAFTARVNEKYETDYAIDFYLENETYRVRPSWVFALSEADFTGTPTCWSF
jgi:PPOX class probable F420-dependent enzyme